MRTRGVPCLVASIVLWVVSSGLASSFLRGFEMALVMRLHALYNCFSFSVVLLRGFSREFNRDGDLISVPRDPIVRGKVSFEFVVIVGFGVIDRVVKDFAR
jgi:hypothetical protein